jgi:hypothetical protein
MAVSVTHSTVATLPDEAGAEVNKAEWNAPHTVTGLGTMATQDTPTASFVAVSGAADTNENILGTITIPAAFGTNGFMRLRMKWTLTNNANTKTARVRFGGIGGTIHYTRDLGNNATQEMEVVIGNRNAANSQVGYQKSFSTIAIASAAVTTGAIDTAPGTTAVITIQKTTAGDTCTLEAWDAQLVYA